MCDLFLQHAEVLSVNRTRSSSSLVLGAVQKGFAVDHEPGTVEQSVGFRPSDGRFFSLFCLSMTRNLMLVL